MSDEITQLQLEKKILEEFRFFDSNYFKTRDWASISAYFAGSIPVCYGNLFEFILNGATMNTTIVNIIKKIKYRFGLYLDLSYSGKAIDESKIWA